MKKLTSILFASIAITACIETADSTQPEALHAEESELAVGGDHIDGEPAGAMWGPCVFDSTYGGAEANGWGCDGGIEGGLVCAKPLWSSGYLSICVPRNEGGCAVSPFGLGFDDSRAYCVPLCDDAGDCAESMECSSFGMCAWTGE